MPVMTIPTARAAGGPAADGSGKITREAVLAAALQIIDRDGAEALSMPAPGPEQYQQLIDGRLDVGIGRAALAPPRARSGPGALRPPVRRAGGRAGRRAGHRAAAARRGSAGAGVQPV